MTTTCPKCGYTRQPADTAPDYECPQCGVIYSKYDPSYVRPLTPSERYQLQEQANAAARQRLAKMCITTTPTVPNREIESVIEVVSAECAYGMNLFKDMFTAITNTVGGRSGSIQNTLRDARRQVMADLRNEAFSVGADAVVGVSLDYSEFSGGGRAMLFVVATGTAVKLKHAT